MSPYPSKYENIIIDYWELMISKLAQTYKLRFHYFQLFKEIASVLHLINDYIQP